MSQPRPVAGWKAGLLIIGALVAAFVLLNWLGNRYVWDRHVPKPTPTIIR